jgi:O-antigen ligase
MGLYLTHSLREYLAGRHTYRMGIARMIGVDKTLGDPNSFGASIVFVLPFVTALWRAGVGGRSGKIALTGFTGLAVLCLLLTGSRSSLLGLVVWAGLVTLRMKQRWLFLAAGLAAAPVVFLALPESLQTRFETIVNPEVGPENARQSGEGRIAGFFTGLELLARSPVSGVGPGAWRPATGSSIESHNLYGQLLGELGALGALGFAAILAGFWLNLRRVAAIRREHPEWADDLVFQVASAVGTAVLLLLFLGMFGHNLFRFSWLWYGGFLIIARHCVEQRVAELEWEATTDPDVVATEPVAEPDGWMYHEGHG